MRLRLERLDAGPLGLALAVGDGKTLVALDFADCEGRLRRLLARRWPDFDLQEQRALPGLADRLRAYLGGRLDAWDDLPLDPGGTDFQRKVWQALRQIPAGRTMTYGEMARQLGLASAPRAVGHANGANPIAIAIPCHRLVGADGRLTGYAGGLRRKAWLLSHEGARKD